MLTEPFKRLDKELELREQLLPYCRLKRGEIWMDSQTGHKVGVLDAIQTKDVRSIFGMERSALAIQDPPYNVAVGTKNTAALFQWDLSQYMRWSKQWVENNLQILSDNASLYVWLGADQREHFQPLPDFVIMMRGYPEIVSRSFITMRNQRGYGTQKNWMAVRQECLYYTKGNPMFDVQAEYTDIPKILRGYYKEVNGQKTENLDRSKSENIRAGNVWVDVQQVFYRMQENLAGCYAQKPLKAIERIIKASSREGDLITDFFAHSGTTLLAGEISRRKVYTFDIDPVFAELTIRRLEHFRKTGQTGFQVSNPFPEIADLVLNYQIETNHDVKSMAPVSSAKLHSTKTITYRNAMASLAKVYSEEKLNGLVYTPAFIVRRILDDIGYTDSSILGKRIIDPACGDGRFLIEVVKRVIEFSPTKTLKQNLECIYGWDINPTAVQECIDNLNELVSIPIDWNVRQTNSIKHIQNRNLFASKEDAGKFDYIVGNPPYIRIQHLDIEQRQYIQKNYAFCKSGSTDIYIAFYELCLSLLTDGGVCGLITPNTFLHTETARPLRQYFTAHQNIRQLTNYGDVQLFDDATTYSAITIFDKQKHNRFLYQRAYGPQTMESRQIAFTELTEPFWRLSHVEPTTELANGKKLKDICKIHVGITTLCDSVYIFPIEKTEGKFAFVNTKLRGTVKIEKEILKPIVKGSKLKNAEQKITEYVLFPYEKQNGKHIIISEEELQHKFPLAYDYLLLVKSELDNRDNGKPNPVAWYAFGRSQGLDTSFGAKIIFSPMNHRPNFVYYENPECTFYSGYCIKYDGDVESLLLQLNSARMQEFVSASSRDFRGGWKAYNKKIIENFEVDANSN